jgi:hypothetical protein
MRPSRSPNLLPGDYQPSSQRSQHFLAISQAFYCGGANIPRIRLQRGSDMMEGKLRKRRHTAEWNKLDCMQSFAVCRVSNKYPKQECSCTTSNCRFMCVSVAARRLRPKRFYKSTTSRIHQHLVFIPAETSPSMTAPSSLSLHSHARFPPILHFLAISQPFLSIPRFPIPPRSTPLCQCWASNPRQVRQTAEEPSQIHSHA